jgi:Na+/melibiose symporter-like transporter
MEEKTGQTSSYSPILPSNEVKKKDSILLNDTEDDGDGLGKADPMIRDGVTSTILAAYSVGHFANDLCASMWFIYLSYYLINVVQLSQSVSGLCLLSGQIADGITTPIVGYMSDRVDSKCGKRNLWYYMGTILVIPSFLCIFLDVPFFSTDGAQNAWYLLWPAIFNVGWAAV